MNLQKQERSLYLWNNIKNNLSNIKKNIIKGIHFKNLKTLKTVRGYI